MSYLFLSCTETLITYKDPSQPQKARMVISGTALKLYDDNNIERIYIGL